MSKYTELKEAIERSLLNCNETDTPTVCAALEANREKVINNIIDRVNAGSHISEAIISLENEYNTNSYAN